MFYFHNTNEALAYGTAIAHLSIEDRKERIFALRKMRQSRLDQVAALSNALDNTHNNDIAAPLLGLSTEIAFMGQLCREAIEACIAERALSNTGINPLLETYFLGHVSGGYGLRKLLDKGTISLDGALVARIQKDIKEGRQ